MSMTKNKKLFYKFNFFYLLVFPLTGVLYGLSLLICKSLKLGLVETALITTMSAQLAPACAAMISRKRYSVNIAFFVKPKLNWAWLLIILIPLLGIGSQHVILQSMGQAYIHSAFFVTPSLIILSVTTTLIGSIGEEVGWRGYLYKTFRTDMKPWTSSLIVGIAWGLWHFTKIFQLGFVHYLVFTLSVIPISLLLTYMNDKSGGSILPSILLHTCINLSYMSLLFERETMIGYFISISVLTVIVLLVRGIDSEYFTGSCKNEQQLLNKIKMEKQRNEKQ